MAAGVRAIAALPDPVGEQLERRTLESGLDLRKVRVPLGVVAVIYEARPNVTVDCAALCLKSGNAIVLRGSSYAERSNAALAALVREAVAEAGLPEGAVELLGGDRAELEAAGDRRGPGRPGDPPRRRGAQGGAEGGRDGAGDVRGGAATATSTCTPTPTSRWRGGSPTTRRSTGPASATRPRRCSSTPTSRRSSCPRSSPSSQAAGVELVGDGRARRPRARRRSARRPTPTGTPSTSG